MAPFAPVRLLRSRRLAVWLLALAAVWALLGTVAPITRPYSHPAFLALIALLAASTTLCAWERTLWAWRARRAFGAPGEREREAAASRPRIAVPVVSTLDSAQLAEEVRSRLDGQGLRAVLADDVVEASAGSWSVFGSPVFHWALALLMLVVGLGRLTRSEGLVGVPVGGSVRDVAESYGRLQTGPLFPGLTGRAIEVPEMDLDYATPDGVSRGEAPVVVLRGEGGAELARARVYPNSPLRHGATMIHVNDYGFSPEVSLLAPDGQTIGTVRPIMDIVEGSSRTTTAHVDLSGISGPVYTVELAMIAKQPEPTLATAVFDVATGDLVSQAEVAVGDTTMLPTGDSLSFDRAGTYARLSVVHDWSVYPIYAILAIGLLALALAVLDPYRRVVVLVAEEGAVRELRAVLRHGRGSALFEARIREALEEVADVV